MGSMIESDSDGFYLSGNQENQIIYKGRDLRKQLHLCKFIALSAISMLLFNTWSLELTGGQENVYAMEKSPAVQSGFDYSSVFDAAFYATLYPDVAATYGNDTAGMYKHFITYGIAEGRQPSAEFNVQIYMSNYPDLVSAFGSDMAAYYQHYITYGKAEGRIASVILPGVTLMKMQSDWKLILVNKNHLLSKDFVPPLDIVSSGRQMRSEIAPVVKQMLSDAKAQGVNLTIVSAYRDASKQALLFKRKTNYYLAEGLDRETAEANAATVVERPGNSEHQTGLAMDITDSSFVSLTTAQENTAGYKWLFANCAKYGFILRYPQGKETVTGVIYEPWHFRYVGKDAAQAIMTQGISLEEYLNS